MPQLATPLSNHTSNTSLTLYIFPPHSHSNTTSSILGLCKSKSSFHGTSFILPTTFHFPHLLHIHTGIGIPQYLCLLIHQSLAFLTQSLNLAIPAHSGIHLTLSISSIIFSLIFEIVMNHCSVALYMIGVLHLQQ